MSSEPAVGYAPNTPDTSDDDRSQPERGMGTWSSGENLNMLRRGTKSFSGRRSLQSVARGAQVDGYHAVLRQNEEMEHKEKVVTWHLWALVSSA
jgi:hypothetical protein